MEVVSSLYFSKEQVASGEMTKFLEFLFGKCYSDGFTYCDIHIYPEDCGAFRVEYAQVPWSHDYGGKFVFVDCDHTVMLEKTFPDGSLYYVFDEDEWSAVLKKWLKKHKKEGWQLSTITGRWSSKYDRELV